MIVFPAIDLKGGQVVRLAEGDMARATVYGDDPAAQAMLFAEAGSQFLHVVDLDGSFAGRAENRQVNQEESHQESSHSGEDHLIHGRTFNACQRKTKSEHN